MVAVAVVVPKWNGKGDVQHVSSKYWLWSCRRNEARRKEALGRNAAVEKANVAHVTGLDLLDSRLKYCVSAESSFSSCLFCLFAFLCDLASVKVNNIG